MVNALSRINRVSIAPQTGTPAWDQVENYAAPALTYVDLEMTADSTMTADQPRIATTGQRGDGETPLAAEGNRDAASSLAVYLRGLDLAGGAGNGISTATAAPQYDAILQQTTGGTVTNTTGDLAQVGSTRWVVGVVNAAHFAVGNFAGWVNPAFEMEAMPIVDLDLVANTITIAGEAVGATGGFSAAPAAGNVIYASRTYKLSQQAGERTPLAIHADLADGNAERFFLGCFGSLGFSDADGLLLGSFTAQAHDWKAASELVGPPAFGAFVGPTLGPVSTRGGRAIISSANSWGVTAGTHVASPVAIPTVISGELDVAVDIQPRTAQSGTNGRQGFVAVDNGCAMPLRLYHDGVTAGLLGFGDASLLSLQEGASLAVARQYGTTPGNVVCAEVPSYQGDAVLGEEAGLATIDLTGRGYRPSNLNATIRIHLL